MRGVNGLEPATARKIDFYTRQFVDAISPSNFLATNPEVLAATLETGGQNLVRGLENLLENLQRGEGRLSIIMTDMEAFQLGENIAATPGKVVFQNELMQLTQYTPTTPDARRRPLLIVPPAQDEHKPCLKSASMDLRFPNVKKEFTCALSRANHTS